MRGPRKKNNFFLDQGIYDTKELYNFNFHPINVNIKNSHGIIQSKTLNQMQWEFSTLFLKSLMLH